jgi:hypothetical protein
LLLRLSLQLGKGDLGLGLHALQIKRVLGLKTKMRPRCEKRKEGDSPVSYS